jgi:hypothetical protein
MSGRRLRKNNSYQPNSVTTEATHVEAADGHIGREDDLIISPENNHITHLALVEGYQ